MKHPILTVTIALAVLFLVAGEVILSNDRWIVTPPRTSTHVRPTVDPAPPGSIGWYTHHGNPICAFLYSYRDPKRRGDLLTAINMIPYYGKNPSKRWDPTHREMPQKQAGKLCHSLGALLWHP